MKEGEEKASAHLIRDGQVPGLVGISCASGKQRLAFSAVRLIVC